MTVEQISPVGGRHCHCRRCRRRRHRRRRHCHCRRCCRFAKLSDRVLAKPFFSPSCFKDLSRSCFAFRVNFWPKRD